MRPKDVSKQLLVEGNDDMHVFMSLFGQHNVPQEFSIIQLGWGHSNSGRPASSFENRD